MSSNRTYKKLPWEARVLSYTELLEKVREEKPDIDEVLANYSKELMKDEILVQIAKELVETVNSNMTIDWDIRKDARAKMRIEIKKLLIKYNYPPNKSEKAVQTVIRQAELKCKEMIG